MANSVGAGGFRRDEVTLLSQVHPDGSYGVTLRRGETVRWLSREQVYAHAAEVVAAARRARYDAALLRQLTEKLSLPYRDAMVTVREVAAQRLPLDAEALNPLELRPRLMRNGDPVLAVGVGGRKLGYWTPADARQHAMACLELAEVVRLDNGYFAFLRGEGEVGLDEGRARAVVAGLAEFLDEEDGGG